MSFVALLAGVALQMQRPAMTMLPRDLGFLARLHPKVSLVVIQDDSDVLRRLEREEKELLEKYFPDSPDVKAARRKIAEFKSQMKDIPRRRDQVYQLDFGIPEGAVKALLAPHLRLGINQDRSFVLDSGSFGSLASRAGLPKGVKCRLAVTEPLFRPA